MDHRENRDPRETNCSEETTVSLAAEAGRKALENAKIDAEQIDLLIVSTFTPDKSLPNTACAVQGILGCRHAVAFEMNAACSGFLFALNTAYAYFSLGVYKKALIIGAETISKGSGLERPKQLYFIWRRSRRSCCGKNREKRLFVCTVCRRNEG